MVEKTRSAGEIRVLLVFFFGKIDNEKSNKCLQKNKRCGIMEAYRVVLFVMTTYLFDWT